MANSVLDRVLLVALAGQPRGPQFNFLLRLSIPILYLKKKKKSGIDKSTERSTIPACPGLMCFFLTGVTPRGLVLQKIVCSMFVYVLFYGGLCTGLILWFSNNLWFEDLCGE